MNRVARSILVVVATLGVTAVSSFEAGAARVVSGQKARSTRAPREKPAQPAQPEVSAKGELPAGPMAVFSDIERGWNGNNVDLILKHFGKGKVSIAIEAGPTGGNFSKSQSYYLLKDLFKYTITKKFEFTQYRKPNESGKSTFAVAERLYQKTDDGRLFKDKIYVSLHADEDGQWVVNEIKSIR